MSVSVDLMALDNQLAAEINELKDRRSESNRRERVQHCYRRRIKLVRDCTILGRDNEYS